MEQLPVEWYLEVPVVTRLWTSAIAASALLEQCGVVSKTQLTYSYAKVFHHQEYWRLVTTFLYFGPLSVNFIFNALFVAKYSRMLEEAHYRNRSRNYAWVLFLGASSLIIIASLVGGGGFAFLGPYLSNCLIYLWSRRNPGIDLPFLGLFNFTAPYLPWVIILFSMLLNGPAKLKGQLVGTLVGHVIFYFEDVYPRISRGRRLLAPPWAYFVEEVEQDR